MQSKSNRKCVLLAIAFSFCSLGLAQTTSGDLVGTIYDATGATVPNATIVATNAATSVFRNGNFVVLWFLPHPEPFGRKLQSCRKLLRLYEGGNQRRCGGSKQGIDGERHASGWHGHQYG